MCSFLHIYNAIDSPFFLLPVFYAVFVTVVADIFVYMYPVAFLAQYMVREGKFVERTRSVEVE